MAEHRTVVAKSGMRWPPIGHSLPTERYVTPGYTGPRSATEPPAVDLEQEVVQSRICEQSIAHSEVSKGGQVRLGFTADSGLNILREEIVDDVLLPHGP